MSYIFEFYSVLKKLFFVLLLLVSVYFISSCSRVDISVQEQKGYEATCFFSIEGSKAVGLSPLDVKSLAVLVFDASGKVESRLSVDPSSPGGTFFVPGPGRVVYAFANCGDMSFVSNLSDLDAVCFDFSADTFDPAYPPMSGTVNCPASLLEGTALNVVLKSLVVKVTLGTLRNGLDSVFGDFYLRGMMLVRACSKVTYHGVGSVPLNVDGLPADQCMVQLITQWVNNGYDSQVDESLYCCPTSSDGEVEFMIFGMTGSDRCARYYYFSLKDGLSANREYKINLSLVNPGSPTVDGPHESGDFDLTVGIPGWGDGTEIDAEI